MEKQFFGVMQHIFRVTCKININNVNITVPYAAAASGVSDESLAILKAAIVAIVDAAMLIKLFQSKSDQSVCRLV